MEIRPGGELPELPAPVFLFLRDYLAEEEATEVKGNKVNARDIWPRVKSAMIELNKDPEGETAREIANNGKLTPKMLESYNKYLEGKGFILIQRGNTIILTWQR